jgi:hypothetical protein
VADWQTISSLATAAGTLVLAVATFSAVRSSNRSARVAESALLAGMRPVLLPSLADDPPVKVIWMDRHVVQLPGGRAVAEQPEDVIYLALAIRNAGSGLAVLHGWYVWPQRMLANDPHADPGDFRRMNIDLYIAAGAAGFWEGAVRDADDPAREDLEKSVAARELFTIDLLYGDQEGGQRTISRFMMLPGGEDGWYTQVSRHWNLDRDDPR